MTTTAPQSSCPPVVPLPSVRALPALLGLAVLLAGCVAQPAGEGPVAPASEAGGAPPGFAQDHDHLDPTLHEGFGHGLDRLAYHNLAPEAAAAGDAAQRGAWINSEIIVRGDHAFVGYIGAPWLFAIVDVRDAAAPRLVGVFETANAWTMDLAVSEDGNWVFASVYPGAAGTLFASDYLVRNAQAPTGAPLPGVMVVDARDKANPVMTGFLPVHGLGPHTATYHRYEDGREVVFANKADAPPGNAVVVAEVVGLPTGGRTLRPLTAFTLNAVGSSFPHDVDVALHPVTGQTLLYAAYWSDGLVVVDVSDPANPMLVSRSADVPEGEEVNVHDVHPYPRLVGGRHYTLTAPEMPTGDATGHLRVWDTTDPAAPVHVASWTLPGEYVVDHPFSFSPHNFVFLPDGRVALAHGHAGVWVVEWLDAEGAAPLAQPRAVAWALPHAAGAKPPAWTPVHGVPWAWGTATDAAGNLWVADVTSGLHGYRVADA